MLWNWASLRETAVTERHDSFLERFRGPELKDLNQDSNTKELGRDDALGKKK